MASTGSAHKPRPRPLSPFLIYAWSITMAASIANRATGVGLYVGVLLLAWFLLALSGDATSYATFAAFIHSIIGQLALFAFTLSLFFHLLAGVRHMLMDADIGLDKPLRDPLAWSVFVGAVALTIVAWVIGYAVR